MKLTDLAIIFILFISPFTMYQSYKMDRLSTLSHKVVMYNRYVDTAVEDGVAQLIDFSSAGLTLQKERAVDSFFNSLALNFNYDLNDRNSRYPLMPYVPVILVIYYDGIHSYTYTSYKQDGEKILEHVWHPQVYFTEERGNYVFYYTLTDELRILNKMTGSMLNGLRADLATSVNDPILRDESLFHQRRRIIIIDTIEKVAGYRLKEHNHIAKAIGINYSFQLPTIKEEDWYNTVDDPSLLVFIQGIPTGIKGEVYNSYSFGGARLSKTKNFTIIKDASGISYYHRLTCDKTRHMDNLLLYSSPESCAIEGAFPCIICKP